ncbi:hypothetical protein [Paraburkholderia kururiensis]|uniref:hypothetical protein n=1 Tax=Paraburkholderia kururiensis TaxID=984307 RepID=UPI0005A65950|nr:hypothetical protein [Paraburkholderia kururiensis]
MSIDKRISILSDGTPHGTRVLDADGKQIEGCITRVEWSIETDKIGEARITFANPIVRVDGEAVIDG